MKLILTEKVRSLGDVGEFVNVSAGYARNYLLPNGFAMIADQNNTKAFENQKKALAKKVEDAMKAAQEIKGKIDGLKIELVKKVGSNGKLFGTVTNTELSKELLNREIDIERRQIVIENPIKQIGSYDVKAKLFKGVEATFKVSIMMDPKQAEELKKKQAAAEKKAAAKKEAAAAKVDEAASAEVNAEEVQA